MEKEMMGTNIDLARVKRTAAWLLSLFAFVLTACGMQGGAPGLEDTQWKLLSLGPSGAVTSLVEGSTVTLSAADGKIGGSGGCNSYGGEYQVKGNEVTFDDVNSTLMACADERLTQQEGEYFQALQAVKTFEIIDARLYLYDETGQLLLTFEGGPSSAPTATP